MNQRWYVMINSEAKGPFTASTIRQMAEAGVVTPNTKVSSDLGESWHNAELLKNLTFGDPANDAPLLMASPRTRERVSQFGLSKGTIGTAVAVGGAVFFFVVFGWIGKKAGRGDETPSPVVGAVGNKTETLGEASSSGGRVVRDTAHKPGDVVELDWTTGVRMKFCWIPPGEAQLGAPADELNYAKTIYENMGYRWWNPDDESESKRGKFVSKGFWMAKYPVTQEEYIALLRENPSEFSREGKQSQKSFGLNTLQLPVDNVRWFEANQYIKKLNGHIEPEMLIKVFGSKGVFALPHEDQWEYACRGGRGNQQPFYFGSVCNGVQANVSGAKYPFGTEEKGPALRRTTEVGSYEKIAPHPWGLCDMCGNVCQWCCNLEEPGSQKVVLRGGFFGQGAVNARSAYRRTDLPENRNEFYGFRVVYLP